MTVFVKDMLERAGKTFVQVMLTFFVGDITVLSVDWSAALGVSFTAALVSLGTSYLSKNAGGSNGTASLVPEITTGRHAARG